MALLIIPPLVKLWVIIDALTAYYFSVELDDGWLVIRLANIARTSPHDSFPPHLQRLHGLPPSGGFTSPLVHTSQLQTLVPPQIRQPLVPNLSWS